MVSVIIPTYNESKVIGKCLQSLHEQTYQNLEIIIVDDGSTDDTLSEIQNSKFKIKNLYILKQNHHGPGVARNLAASHAKGEILVFIDADMTFEKDFLKKVIAPIKKKIIGTDSQNGVLANTENYWARMWNLGKFAAAGNYSQDYLHDLTPDKTHYGAVYRAILKKEFLRVGGFDTDGDYTDDVSLYRKLKIKAKMVNARFFHYNPDTLTEVWLRASWIGGGKNFTSHKYFNLLRFFPLISVIKGLVIGARFRDYSFVFFKMTYDTAVFLSLCRVILNLFQDLYKIK